MPSVLSTPAAPASLSRGERWRLWTAIRLGDLAALASRLSGRGSGASIRGQVLTRIDPDAFAELVQGHRVLAVSGTNGKTTTTHLLAAAIRAGLGGSASRLVTNADGANLHYGIASALSQQPKSDIAVLETDERVVSDMIAHARPELLVLLNFSRDQLDRHHEIKALGRSWRHALEVAAGDGPTIVANACDPLVVWSAGTAARVIWVETATVWNADGALCPACGAVLRHVRDDDRERWDCPGCELTQPEAGYRVEGDRIVLPDGSSVPADLQVPGSFNVSNAACALAAAIEFGVPLQDALTGMHSVTAPAGRFATAHFGATRARLLLAKNPAGWAEALPLAASDPVILAIDSVAADGKDVSWLWDVEYEQLSGRTVVCTGPRAQDLAVRLSYAGVDHEVVPDLRVAIGQRDLPIDVIATYTPFQRLLKMAGLR
jgi:UDP-N-acetylmuramyl tripeptide synthase